MSLLTVSREIRQQILGLAIASPVDPPKCPSVCQSNRQRLSRGVGYGVWREDRLFSSALPLLLVSKEINQETRYLIQRVQANYHVDIMFAKDHGLWPTWSVPAPPRTCHIDTVTAAFRLFDPTDDLDSRFENSLRFMQGSRVPAVGIWSFYALLACLLYHGPGSNQEMTEKPGKAAANYVVKKLVIDVLPPSDGAAHKSIFLTDAQELEMSKEHLRKIHRTFRDHADPSMPTAERLAEFILQYIDLLMSPTRHCLSYKAVVYEGIRDSIDVLVNGKLYHRYDMDELAAKLYGLDLSRRTDYSSEQKTAFDRWKPWLRERRERMKKGLEFDKIRPVDVLPK